MPPRQYYSDLENGFFYYGVECRDGLCHRGLLKLPEGTKIVVPIPGDCFHTWKKQDGRFYLFSDGREVLRSRQKRKAKKKVGE